MNSKRVYYLTLAVLGMLVICIGVATFEATKILGKESKKLVSLKLQNRVLDEQQNSLATAKKSLAKYNELDKIARTVLPQDKDQARAVREITDISGGLGIKLSGINFPQSALGSEKVKTKDETQVLPVDGIPGVYEMMIQVQQDAGAPIPYPTFLEFLTRLEKNRRTAQVSSITVLPNDRDRSKISFNMTVKLYIKP